jgi:Mrp family chromosome partitioning ATPase
MALPVLVAVSGAHEAALVAGLEAPGSTVRVVRRCADLSELLSAAAAGLARAVVVSLDLPRLDGEALARLRELGLVVVALLPPDHPAAPATAAADGIDRLPVDDRLAAAAPAQQVAAVILAAVERRERESAASPGSRPAGEGGTPEATGEVRAVSGAVAVRDGGPRPMPFAGPAGGLPLTPGRVVAVWGPIGAPGRTTVAVTLAAELAQLGQSTMLADADTYGASVAQVLGLLDESAGLGAAVRAALQGGLDAERLARLAPVVSPRLRVLTGLVRPSRWPELRPAGLDLVWQQARQVSAWTVVDCGFSLEADEEISFDTSAPRRNGATLSALAAADVVIAVGAADPVGLQRLVRGLQELADVIPPGRAPRVVVTRVRAASVGSPPGLKVTQALTRYAGVTDPVLVPDDRSACDVALLEGRTLTEAAPGSPARRVLAGLARALVAERHGSSGRPGPGTGTGFAGGAGTEAGKGRRGRRGARV